VSSHYLLQEHFHGKFHVQRPVDIKDLNYNSGGDIILLLDAVLSPVSQDPELKL